MHCKHIIIYLRTHVRGKVKEYIKCGKHAIHIIFAYILFYCYSCNKIVNLNINTIKSNINDYFFIAFIY